jgi:hypothetical protein
LLALLLTLSQFVEADAEHARNQFELGVVFVVFTLARVGGNGLAALLRQLAVSAHLIT